MIAACSRRAQWLSDMEIKFNVFGKRMSVQRKGSEWLLFADSDSGLKSRVYDVVIPPELEEDGLAGYLDDMYHEYATESANEVIRL